MTVAPNEPGADYDVHELEQAVAALCERYRDDPDALRAESRRILEAASGLWSLTELLGLRRAA